MGLLVGRVLACGLSLCDADVRVSCGKTCTSYWFNYSLLGCHYTGVCDIKTQISPIDYRYLAYSHMSSCAPPPATCESIRATETLAAEDSSCQD